MTTHAIETREEKLAGRDAPDWVSLAAAPTFALMALVTGMHGGGSHDVLCAAALDASPLNGMMFMYLLMSAFHSAPWLRLMAGRRNERSRTTSGTDVPRASLCRWR